VSDAPLLSVNNIEVIYDHVILVLKGVSLTVPEGGIVALLGANGAGKTTTLRAVSGTVRRSGSIRLAGEPLRGGPESAARAGVAHVPEGRGTFTELTVVENLRLGAYTRRGSAAAELERVGEWFPWVLERGGQQAGTLSGGEQQMLALGRARLTRPRLILLDEPSLGLAPLVVQDIFAIIARINREQGVAMLLV